MKHFLLILTCSSLLLATVSAQTPAKPSDIPSYSTITQKIIDAAMKDSAVFERLTELVDRFPARISGSENLEKSIDWSMDEMKKDGLENVHTHPVSVPNWKRGKEYAQLTAPVKRNLPMLGLGGSIATPKTGIEAEVAVFSSLDDLKANPDRAKGKIVLINQPFTTYGGTVAIRTQGANEASRAGAVASLIRSVASFSMQTPHTGVMRYADDVKKIPHAAITTEDADWIARTIDRGETVKVKLYMEAETLPNAMSRNLMAEWRGSEFPDEVVVIGGHIDSWDVGQGAMDDAGGCVVSWEVLRLLKELNLRPKRTIRVVFWTNEENGLEGGNVYKDSVMTSINKHVAAIESDAGVFAAQGFGFGGKPENMPVLQEIAKLLEPIGAGKIVQGGGGADIGPLMREGVPGFGLNVDGEKYFWYHHTEADTIDKLDPKEVNSCVAAMAVLAYVLADMPGTLIR